MKEAESLEKNDCEVTILGLEDSREIPSRNFSFDISLIHLKSRKYRSKIFLPLKFAELIFRNYQFLMQQDVHVIHCHDISPMFVAWLVSLRKKIPIVYDSHELEYDRNLSSKALKLFNRYYEKLLIGKASQIIVSEGAFRAEVMHDVHRLHAPVTYVRNCPPRVTDKDLIQINLKEKLGVPENSRILLYVGNIGPGRGTIQTLESLLHLPKEVILVVIGTVQDNGVFNKTKNELGLDDRVFAIGPFPYKELIRYTTSADIGLCLYENTCLSYYHSTPTKLFDYIAAGVPPLTSNFPAMSEIVENSPDGEIGVTVSPENPVDIAQGIKIILDWDNEKLGIVKGRMKKLHLSQFNWDEQEKNLISVYENFRDQ
ncbi:glycosyltransferase family 4 protein [Granulosicoccus sp. 3-233]|uniref:glycosyltransferase family 4 protein n=1 Tax=Granulosicoccus sp. 3-233 TaxID=3417969 RepID=UPI003D331546